MRVAPPFPPLLVRLFLGTLVVFGAVAVPVSTQVPGQNVNMISVDKYLQKQNEVDLTISPVNPCHIVGAANDYRTVNNKGLNTDGEIGDSWVGVYVSTDCGDTWLNYIMPGYGQGYTTAADPIARFGPGGGLYISHMQFNRGTNWGRIAIARYFDFNNFEGVPASTYNNTADKDESDPYASPVGYLGTTEVARGSAGQFLDKPSMAVAPGQGVACSVNGVTIPATNVYVAWSEFTGNGNNPQRSKVYFARSTDCGKTLAGPATKLSEGDPLNQGTVIAVHPTNPNIIYVAWRQVATGKTVDAINFVKSTDGGKTFTKPMAVPPFDGVTPANSGYAYKPFDQPTTSTTFRTLGYPAMVVDEAGRAYLVVSARVGPSTPGNLPTDSATPGAVVNLPEARILVTSTADGVYWETPTLVDAGTEGHQFMPALAYAGGRLNLTWYDLRYDESNVFRAFADEKDAILGGIRHTLDVRGAQAAVPPTSTSSWPLTFQVYGVSDIGDDKRKVSLYYAQNGTTPGVQLNFNPANLKLYAGGTKPFIGDYIGTAGLQYVPNGPGRWKFNDATAALNNTVLRTFHTAWTDNRDAIVGAAGYPGQPTSNPNLDYVAPGTGSGCAIGTPEFAKANSRNANIYTSRITPGLFLSALGNTKPGTIERAFAVQVENGTASEMKVRLSIGDGQPASFTQPASTGTRALDLTIGPFSSTARTVYVAQAASGSPRIDVVAAQTNGSPNNLRAAIVLNGDPISTLVQPGSSSDPVASKETHNPRVENPRVENPRVENTSVKNPRVENPRVENPRVENPRVENTTVETPRVENPRVENPRVENQGLQNAPYSDITYEVTNDGNTTSAFDLDLRTAAPTAGYEFQLIAWRGYKLPYVSADCTLSYREDPQVLINEPLLPGDFGSSGLPADKRASVVVRPGETISWTLRAYDANKNDTFEPFCVDPVLNPAAPNSCANTMIVRAAAQAVNSDAPAGTPPPVSTWPPPLQITTTTPLPDADFGVAYSQTLVATGAVGPYTWSVLDGRLPPGLLLSSAGQISGTPVSSGKNHTFTVQVVDSLSRFATKPVTLRVTGASYTRLNTDYVSAGVGAVWGSGSGTITIAGISGNVTKALLYWQGPTTSTDPAVNASVQFANQPVTGTNIGFSQPDCWGPPAGADFINCQAYRADVTALVSAVPASYALTGFRKETAGAIDAVTQGISLLVFYDDGNPSNNKDVYLFDGEDSSMVSQFDAAGWDMLMTPVTIPAGSTVSLQLHVAGGQGGGDGALLLNSTQLAAAGPIFQGDSVPPSTVGGLWDIKDFGITSFTTPGSNTLSLTGAVQGAADCSSLVVAAVVVQSVIQNPTLPDLIVETLTHYPPAPTAADLITVTATVRNIGVAPAAPSTLELCIGGENPCATSGVPALQPAAGFGYSREITLTAQGYRNTATADSLNVVTESNETSNVTQDDYLVAAASGITISGMVQYSGAPVSGATVELHRDSTSNPAIRRATTGADGLYNFSSVPDGTYHLKRWGPGGQGYFEWVASQITVAGNDIVRDLDLPKVVTLFTPLSGSTAAGCSPVLTWYRNPEATDHRVQINKTTGWVWVSHTGTFGGDPTYTTYALSTNLETGVNYTWQVDEYDANNHWVGSTRNSFTFVAGGCAPHP